MIQLRPPYLVHKERFSARIEPTKGCTYQVYRCTDDGSYHSTITTLDTNGLDKDNRQIAKMFAASPDMMKLLLDILIRHSNDLPASLLDRIATLIDNIKE